MFRSVLALTLLACGTDPTATDDRDGDGYAPPEDCDDADPDVHPTAPDIPYDGVDSNCVGDDDFDADYDGYPLDEDCDDRAHDVHPGMDEVCDGIDQDCDKVVDDEPVDGILLYPDADGDGSGALLGEAALGCAGAPGTSAVATDCDDLDPSAFPGNPELCDHADNDCDGVVDDGAYDFTSWPDLDGDGYGDGAVPPTQTCFALPAGSVDNPSDCDDADPETYLGAPDLLCDGADNDCDPLTAEAGLVTVDGVAAADLAAAVASAADGATIALCEGTYPANVTLTHRVSVLGAGSALTVLDGQGADAVLAVDTIATVTLGGLTLTNGIGHPDGAYNHQGGGLWVADFGSVDASDLRIVGNRAGEGGGVYLGPGTVFNIDGGAISDNVGDDVLANVFAVGGGLVAGEDSALVLTDVAVERNSARSCGGMDLRFGGVVIDGRGSTAVRDNEATVLAGGGICAGFGADLSGLEISGNTTPNAGGGIYAGAPLLLTDVVLEANNADLDGGGVHLGPSATGSTFVRTAITYNQAGILGGGIYTAAPVTLEDCAVGTNVESFFANDGGGAELFDTTLTSVGTTWSGNVDHDIGLGATYYDAGLLTDFTCSTSSGTCD